MLKVTMTNTATGESWTLYGRLVTPWVDELKASWKRQHCTAEKRKCIVNLDDVTFIDKSGERMLRSMVKEGARFIANDLYIKHVLDRVKGRNKNRKSSRKNDDRNASDHA
jgi:hypothetical protein